MYWFHFISGVILFLLGLYLYNDPVRLIKLIDNIPACCLRCLIVLLNRCPLPFMKDTAVEFINRIMEDDGERIRCMLALEKYPKVRICVVLLILLCLGLVFSVLFWYCTWAITTHEMMCTQLDSHSKSRVSFSYTMMEQPLYVLCSIIDSDEPYVVVLKNHSTFSDSAIQSNFSWDPSTNKVSFGEEFRNISELTLNYGCAWYTFTWVCDIDLPIIPKIRRDLLITPSHFIDEAKQKRREPHFLEFIVAVTVLLILSLFMCCMLLYNAIICIFIVDITTNALVAKLAILVPEDN